MWMTFRGPTVSRSRLLDRICVRWSNWKNRRVSIKAYLTMAAALQRDTSFADSLQANIAILIFDGASGKLTHAEANAIADKLMAHLWGVAPMSNAERELAEAHLESARKEDA